MRLIPGKTKVKIEIFKGISIVDAILGAVGLSLTILLAFSTLPFRFYFAGFVALIFIGLLFRVDEEPNYLFLIRIIKYSGMDKHYQKVVEDEMLLKTSEKNGREKILDNMFDILDEDEDAPKKSKNNTKKKNSKKDKESFVNFKDMKDIMPYTEIKNNMINYAGQYYGTVIEIAPIEFRFFSPNRRKNTIENGIGQVLKNISTEYSTNIVKIERPINYDDYLKKEYDKLDQLRRSYESGLITEEELQPRVEILYDHINKLIEMIKDKPVITPFYYVVLFDSDIRQLDLQTSSAIESLELGEMTCRRLNDKELAAFLKYTNDIDFDERVLDDLDVAQYADFAMPRQVDFRSKNVVVNDIVTHNFRITGYSTLVSDCWLASVMSMPATKVVVKCKPMERYKAIKTIDRSLQELRIQLRTTGLDSKAMEIQSHIESLEELLATLQRESENLLQVNIYVTSYDIVESNRVRAEEDKLDSYRANISNMRKSIRRLYRENNFKITTNDFMQIETFVASQISGYDPFLKEGRGIPSNSVAACYPWVFASVSDIGGIEMGISEGIPVFLDFFRRDYERLNSNMVIVGKSGSGKSYATKDVLANLSAENSKIFILDPENEYTELADNLHGKFINVGNARQGRINPFHIITALDDDEASGNITGSYATHLQFLEEFFKQILPDCDKDALEYLNNLVDRMYFNAGITEETDLSKLRPEDYPIFDSLYDTILEEFQQTDNEYIRTNLRTLMNYVAKFSTGGRNANIWNGPSTITTEENFIVFNFQSLLSNRNSTVANAQMLLVLKYVDNEIIKNREYNNKYNLNRKIVVAIDEAHVFIDNKYPIALDFMFQLAKRIRKYNGMQIVITQNIKDFVGSEEIARKSTAIINACQYSFIFSLAPNDIHDLCKLYEKAGGINEIEQEKITSAPRGQVFSVLGPTSRTTFKVEVPDTIVDIFQEKGYQTRYFIGEEGQQQWEEFVGDSREKRAANVHVNIPEVEVEDLSEEEDISGFSFAFEEISEDEAEKYSSPDEETITTSAEPKANVSRIVKEDVPADFDYNDFVRNIKNSVIKELGEAFANGVASEHSTSPVQDENKEVEEYIDIFADLEEENSFRDDLKEFELDGEPDTFESDKDNVFNLIDDENADEFIYGFEDELEEPSDTETESVAIESVGNESTEIDRVENASADLATDNQPTRIETMEADGLEVIEITLQELELYIRRMR